MYCSKQVQVFTFNATGKNKLIMIIEIKFCRHRGFQTESYSICLYLTISDNIGLVMSTSF